MWRFKEKICNPRLSRFQGQTGVRGHSLDQGGRTEEAVAARPALGTHAAFH